ncbi:glycosyltransferase [Dokdonella sp.]|uniref:glycosyltransferase n=1 Tax=Dokdonella sp. TaxID=2291710 RepID=UPI002F424A5E
MHVVDLTLFFAPHSGGVKRYLLAKRAFLATQRDVRHTLLVPGPRTAAHAPGLVELASPRVPFGAGYRVPLRVHDWSAMLRDLRPDLVEAADPYHLAWIAVRVADRLGVAATAFAHSDLARLLGDRVAPAIGRVASAYLRNLYRRFDCVFAPSRLVAERLGDLGVERVALQPLGVDGRVFHPCRADPALRAELGLAADARLLVFAGRLAAEKNVPLLLDAFARLGAPYHLLLVGGERALRLAPHATLLPYQQDGIRLARLLASADALVHAGRHETFGLVVVEAMACARPVVALGGGAIDELVDASVGVVAARADARSLAEAVHALYERDRAAMSALARLRVARDYLWERTLPRQLERYRDLVQASRARAGHDGTIAEPA